MSHDVTPEQPDSPPAEVVADAVYTITQVCRILQISQSKYYDLRQTGRWPIPALQPSLGNARFAGADILRYLRGDLASVHRRRARHGMSVAR